MTPDEAQHVRHYACHRKHRYPNVHLAKEDTTIPRGTRPYRCPFCRGWHVGNPPSMQTLRRVARAIRVLHQEMPV